MKTRFLQIIFILISFNTIGQNPIFTPSTKKNDTISQYPTDCGPDPLYMQANAYSFCSKSPKLRYSYQVDFGNDGKFDLRGTGSKLILTKANGLKYGRHLIKWKVTDVCGKSTEINKIFLVKDAKKPTPVAKLLSIEMLDPKIPAKLEAIKVNNFSWDNCTPMANLRFRIAKAGEYNPNMTLDNVLALNDYVEFLPCIDNGTQTIALFAIDADNNWDYVETFVVVDCNINCDSLSHYYKGNIVTINNRKLKDISLFYNGIKSDSTNIQGNYWLKPTEKLTNISPQYKENIRSSVNTSDIVIISKHLNNIELITSPYVKIASDVNFDNKIDSIDIDIIRNIFLFVDLKDTLLNYLKFVPKDYIFTNDTFNYPQSIVLDSSNKSTKIDFYAIKLGDSNESFFSESYDRAAIPKLPLVLKNQHFTKDEEVRVSLQLPECEAYSYTFQFDPSQLSILRIDGLDEKSYNLQRSSDGIITVLFVNGYSIGDKPNFIFRAIVDGNLKESISINSNLTPAEILKNSDEKSSIYLEFIDEKAQFQLLQNVPNPFTYNTLIKYFSPKKEIIKWNVLNLSGQKIIQGRLESQIGMNDFEIKSEDLTTSGAYILQLITASGIFSQKIIFIKQ